MKKVLFIIHESKRSGAPLLILDILKKLKEEKFLTFEIMLPQKGNLDDELKSLGPLHQFYPPFIDSVKVISGIFRRTFFRKWFILFYQNQLKRRLISKYFDIIYFNSLASYEMFSFFEGFNVKRITHVHELGHVVYSMNQKSVQNMILNSDILISSYRSVSLFLKSEYRFNNEKLLENSVFLLNERKISIDYFQNHETPSMIFTVGGCGLVEARKGTDLFVDFAIRYIENNPKTKINFKWVGDDNNSLGNMLKEKIRLKGLDHQILFTGELKNPENEFVKFSLFFLSSREEAFGIVGLENAYCGIPLLCFDINGDLQKFIQKYNCGFVIQKDDFVSFKKTVNSLIANDDIKVNLGNNGKKAVIQHFNIESSIRVIKESILNV